MEPALEQPFTVEDVTVHVEASIGIALYPDHADDADGLLQRADVAMYQAKSEPHRVLRSTRPSATSTAASGWP